MCLAQGPQCSDAGEARTRGPWVSSQALYHWATALPTWYMWWVNWIGGHVTHFCHNQQIIYRSPLQSLCLLCNFACFYCYLMIFLKSTFTKNSLMPRSHIHGSPRRFHYGLNLTDDPGNAIFRSPIRIWYGCTTVWVRFRTYLSRIR